MKDVDKLHDLYRQIWDLIGKRVDSSSEEFITWKIKTERVLERIYGESSKEIKDFKGTIFSPLVYVGFDDNNETDVIACIQGLKETRAKFKAYLEELRDTEEKDNSSTNNPGVVVNDYSKVFIVHGHDGELKEKVARLLENQDIEPIILSEKANLGKTIIEKIEAYADTVGTAICLFTADDEMKDGSKRARQNVVFETGYFFGKIGRECTIIIAEPETINLSDLSGVVYVNNAHWEIDVLKELREIGYNIDLNKL